MAVNKEYVNENFLKLKDEKGIEFYDLKQIKVKNAASYGPNTFDTNDLVSKAYVDAEISISYQNLIQMF